MVHPLRKGFEMLKVFLSILIVFMTLSPLEANEKQVLQAVMKADTTRLSQLLNDGHDPNAHDADGFTALHYAAINNDSVSIRLLLDAGAMINARTDLGVTPLHITAVKGHHQAMGQLLDAGADPRAKDASGKTPLDWIKPNSPAFHTPAYWKMNDAIINHWLAQEN